MTGRPPLTRVQRILTGVVVGGAVAIAGIGFAGSYAAVRQLALAKGFGWFASVFPIGIDAGIVVLLALDLLLTWLRIPFPLLRHTAWLLTAATIAFNGAAAWPNLLGVGMHAIIPILFVVSVEAARHAIGRIADITADKHMESVRLARWFLAPLPTFRLWRRMKLWELRSYDDALSAEQARLVYRLRLRALYGRRWRWRAPVERIIPLRLARYGVPIDTPQQLVPAAVASLAEAPRIAGDAQPGITGTPTDATPELPAVAPEPEPDELVICDGGLGILPGPVHLPRIGPPLGDAPRSDALAAALAGMSKAAAIRHLHDLVPTASHADLADALQRHGVAASAAHVRSERSRARQRDTETGFYP